MFGAGNRRGFIFRQSATGAALLVACVCLRSAPGVAGEGVPEKLADDLVLYLSADGDAKDRSGNGNDATMYGAKLGEGRDGEAEHAFLFPEGKGPVVQLKETNLLEKAEAMTLSAWIFCERTDGERVIVCHWAPWADQYSFLLEIHEESDKLRLTLSKGDGADLVDISGGPAVPVNEWVHVAAICTDEWAYLIMNNDVVAKGKVDAVFNRPKGWPMVGARGNDDEEGETGCFAGRIDDVAIFSRALRPDELKALSE